MHSEQDQISAAFLISQIHKMIRIARADLRILTLWIVGGLAIGVSFALIPDRYYRAEVKILPYGNGSALGVSKLAGLAGIEVGATDAARFINPALYSDIIQTSLFRIKLSHEVLRIEKDNKRVKAGAYIARQYFKKGFSDTSMIVDTASEIDTTQIRLTQAQEIILDELRNRLKVETDKRTMLVTISAELPDPIAAYDLVNNTARILMQTISAFEVQKARTDRAFIEQQLELASADYNAAQNAFAKYVDQNRIINLETTKIERDKLSRAVQSRFDVFQQLTREFEQAKLRERKDLPSFAIVDPPSVPNTPSGPRRRQRIILFLLVSLLVGISHVFVRYAVKTGGLDPNNTKYENT